MSPAPGSVIILKQNLELSKRLPGLVLGFYKDSICSWFLGAESSMAVFLKQMNISMFLRLLV